jgi:hypothetical protein
MPNGKMLKPQDVVLLTKLITSEYTHKHSFRQLSLFTGLSLGSVHASVQRLAASGLIDPETNLPFRRRASEFLSLGVPYFFPPQIKGKAQGLPTGAFAPFVGDVLKKGSTIPYVWKFETGIEGIELEPIYASVPRVAAEDKNFYAIFSCIDLIRLGKAREREVGRDLIRKIVVGDQHD